MAIGIETTERGRLQKAVRSHSMLSATGMLEYLFAAAFRGLVYPQIWEDPEIDLEALALTSDSRMVAIASGGCNVLSYLTANPAQITAVDLNATHVALCRLKLVAARHLPSWQAFYQFFGEADADANTQAYHHVIAPRLDAQSRRYWEGRGLGGLGRPRIGMFARNAYRYGLLGRFIGLAHGVARLYGVDPSELVRSRTPAQQKHFFDTAIAPLFEKRLVRWATAREVSLYGLGIPPAQYHALAAAGGGDMAAVLRGRIEKLVCGFSLDDNYFAWQAFARRYAPGGRGPLPPYLRRESFSALQDRADRVAVVNRSMTEHLETCAAGSLDRYVLLDAQDWMTDAQLDALWREITRTARPGARVIFRTAAEPSLLPGRLTPALLSRWRYEAARSRDLGRRDRSAIYGGFHLYVLED